MMKRIFALLLCGMLMIGFFSGCMTAEETAASTTESVLQETTGHKYHEPAQSFAGGNGTEADPYQISNAAELALLNVLIVEEDQDDSFDETYTNASYILTTDISLNDTTTFDSWGSVAPEYIWEPIGRTAVLGRFGGVFDGNGHTISGLYINTNANREGAESRNYGLFAEIEGTVKNLTIDQSYIRVSGDVKNVGSVAGAMVLGNALIENCSSAAVLEALGDGSVGGIVGKGDSTIRDCLFSGIITQPDEIWSHLGGISGSDCEISGCVNLGTIYGSGYSGGIVGYGSNVTACINKGSVRGDTAGGIAGNIYKIGTDLIPETTEFIIRSCTNEGSVSAVTTAGGILGNVGNDEADISMYIIDCKNYGQINCDNASAGIIGCLSVERASAITVENCVNHADIEGTGKVSGIICDLRGAILHQEGDVTISGCKNEGSITSTGMYSSGIVTYFVLMGAETDLRLNILDCSNTGTISSRYYAGGILCSSTSAAALDLNISGNSAITLNNCTNSGNVVGQSTNSYIGGIAGNFSAEGIRTTFENCTNSGSVKLELSLTEEEIQETLNSGFAMSISQIVGGIVGRLGEGALLTTDNDKGSAANVNTVNAWIIFRNCHNSGKLETTDYSAYLTADGQQVWWNYIGGIIGNTCAENAYSFSVENCTYSGSNRGLGNTEYSDIGQSQ